MKRLSFSFFILVLVAGLAACTLTGDFLTRELSQEEEKLVGIWTHVHGIGNVWNWEFSTDRKAHYWSTNLIWGSSEGFYLWEADGTTLYIYERDTPFLREHKAYVYELIDEAHLLLESTEYERQ